MCGTPNPAETTHCKKCGVNLKLARKDETEIAHIREKVERINTEDNIYEEADLPRLKSSWFRPWFTIWFHPRQTIQEIVDTNPARSLVLLVVLYGLADGIYNWENAVMIDSDTFQESLLFSLGSSLIIGTVGAFLSGLVMQWITVMRGNRIPYLHLLAASYWGSVPEIGFLAFYLFLILCQILFYAFLPVSGSVDAVFAILRYFGWLPVFIWSFVLGIAALSQVMKCSVWETIGRSIVGGLLSAAPVWALGALYAYGIDALFGYSSYSGDIMLYPTSAAAANFSTILMPAAILVLSLVVLYFMYRASRPKYA